MYAKELRRKHHDFFRTPANITEALLSVEDFSDGEVWEPACGVGDISEVLIAHGLKVFSSDKVNRGYGEQLNFFQSIRQTDHIISNPPYLDNEHLRFCAHALTLARKKVAMMMPLNFIETPRRSLFLKNSPLKAVYVFARRVWTYRGWEKVNPKSGRTCFCWYVWDKSWKEEPVVRWI